MNSNKKNKCNNNNNNNSNSNNMGKSQRGAWSVELRGRGEWTPPLLLQRDLHITRATFSLAPGKVQRWNCAGATYQVVARGEPLSSFIRYTGDHLCYVLNNDPYCAVTENVNKVFHCGDTVFFQQWADRGVNGVLKLEGHFTQSSAMLDRLAEEKRERMRRPRSVYKKYMADKRDDLVDDDLEFGGHDSYLDAGPYCTQIGVN